MGATLRAVHGNRHLREMGKAEVSAFLTRLATQQRVSASTQNQALSALLFLYAQVLGTDIGWLDNVVRAKRPARVPVVLTREEARLAGGAVRHGEADGIVAVWRGPAASGVLPAAGEERGAGARRTPPTLGRMEMNDRAIRASRG